MSLIHGISCLSKVKCTANRGLNVHKLYMLPHSIALRTLSLSPLKLQSIILTYAFTLCCFFTMGNNTEICSNGIILPLSSPGKITHSPQQPVSRQEINVCFAIHLYCLCCSENSRLFIPKFRGKKCCVSKPKVSYIVLKCSKRYITLTLVLGAIGTIALSVLLKPVWL